MKIVDHQLLENHEGVQKVCLSPLGDYLAIASKVAEKSHISFWKVSTLELQMDLNFDKPFVDIHLSSSPNRAFISLGGEPTLIFVDYLDGQIIHETRVKESYRNFSVCNLRKQFSAVSGKAAVKLHSLETGEEQCTMKATNVHSQCMSPDGESLFTGTVTGVVSKWSLKLSHCNIFKSKKVASLPDQVIHLQALSDGKQVLYGTRSEIFIYDLASESSHRYTKPRVSLAKPLRASLNRLFAYGTEEKQYSVWKGRELANVLTCNPPNEIISVDSDSQVCQVAITTNDSRIHLWRIRDTDRNFLYVKHFAKSRVLCALDACLFSKLIDF